MSQPGEVVITKVDHQGQSVISYDGRIVYADGELVVARCAWTHEHSVNLGPFSLDPGDVFCEYYYRARPFNVFGVFDALGRIKGWYCNITDMVEIDGGSIRWHDLALDLLVLCTGQTVLLDEDEFDDLQPTPAQRELARLALATLRSWVAQRKGPFTPALLSWPERNR